MKEYLSKSNAKLNITNAKSFLEYKGEHQEENDKFVKELQLCFAEDKEKYLLVPDSLEEIGETLKGDICMLDMRGPKELNPD